VSDFRQVAPRDEFRFQVNAAGVRGDAILSNDRDVADATWDPVWQAATRVDSLGWTAELRIPLGGPTGAACRSTTFFLAWM
jgi:hypothetical protein